LLSLVTYKELCNISTRGGMHACNLSSQELEASKLLVGSQPEKKKNVIHELKKKKGGGPSW
jgi:hypothetical protein